MTLKTTKLMNVSKGSNHLSTAVLQDLRRITVKQALELHRILKNARQAIHQILKNARQAIHQ
ncbi:hypothetical protein HPB47_012703, partial [Ixodes persulcatus]